VTSVYVCLTSACLSVRDHIFETTRPIFVKFRCPGGTVLPSCDDTVKAKFHYTDTDFFCGEIPLGPCGSVSPQKSPCPGPCRARVRVRVVEFSYKLIPAEVTCALNETAAGRISLRISVSLLSLPACSVRRAAVATVGEIRAHIFGNKNANFGEVVGNDPPITIAACGQLTACTPPAAPFLRYDYLHCRYILRT